MTIKVFGAEYVALSNTSLLVQHKAQNIIEINCNTRVYWNVRH
ncbi:MAG: hypothetical protein ACPG4B_06895 [Cycloclasticus sp.]